MHVLILIVSVLLSLVAAMTGGSIQPAVVPAARATAAPSLTPAPSSPAPAPYDVLAGGGPA